MKATTACVCMLLVCQSVLLYWSAPLSDLPLRFFPEGAVGIRTPTPDAPIVVRNTNDATELYRLNADGTEWYASGVDRAWVQGLLFQARCLEQAQCL